MTTIQQSTRDVQISFRLASEDLRRIDETARRLGLRRADILRLAVRGQLGELLDALEAAGQPADIAS